MVRIARFRECGARCNVHVCPETEEVKLTANYCRDRFCLPCANARARTIAHNAALLVEGHRASFVTFTAKHSYGPLRPQVSRLFKCFAKLRRWAMWKHGVKGGAWFLEVKFNPTSRTWHPHLHVICHAYWMGLEGLRDAWQTITTDSFIVDIREVKSRDQAVWYCTKYASKPLDPSITGDENVFLAAVRELHGVRMCGTFGTWVGHELNRRDRDERVWLVVGRLDAVIGRARQGDPLCLAIRRVVLEAMANVKGAEEAVKVWGGVADGGEVINGPPGWEVAEENPLRLDA